MEQPQYNMFERFKVEMDYLPVYQNVGLGNNNLESFGCRFLTGKYLDGPPEGSRLALKGFEWLRDRGYRKKK